VALGGEEDLRVPSVVWPLGKETTPMRRSPMGNVMSVLAQVSSMAIWRVGPNLPIPVRFRRDDHALVTTKGYTPPP
jgi:hypothetical protein